MGIYSTNNIINESSVLDMEVEASVHEASLAGAMSIIAENETNYTNLMIAIGLNELAYLEENGVEMQYEGASLKSFFEKIKAFFIKIFEKIKGLFKKFIAMMDAKILSDKNFVKKYRQALIAVVTTDFEYKGYKYTIGEAKLKLSTVEKKLDDILKGAGISAEKVAEASIKADADSETDADNTDATKLLEKYDEKKEDLLDEMRAAAIGESGKLEQSEFNEEVYKLLRNGEDDADVIDTVSATDLLSTIAGYKEAKKLAEDDLKDIKKVIDKTISSFSKLEKKMATNFPDKEKIDDKTEKAAHEVLQKQRASMVRLASAAHKMTTSKLNILTSINGAKLSALKSENSQSKAVCVRLLSYKYKNESAFGESSSNLDVNFI